VELGTRGRQDRFSWDVTLFRSLIRDQLLQFTTDPNLIPASTFNAGRTVNQGVELAASVEVVRNIFAAGDKLSITQIWTYNDFRFQNDAQYRNNRIPGLPPHVLRTVVTYAADNGIYVSPSVDIVPVGAFADYANTLKVPSYATVGVQAGFDIKPGISLFLDARNLANKRYISDVGPVTDARKTSTAIFYPGDGLSAYAGVRARF
jgi:iron complex outermembrane receptor protein